MGSILDALRWLLGWKAVGRATRPYRVAAGQVFVAGATCSAEHETAGMADGRSL